jgi:hypothetical protein
MARWDGQIEGVRDILGAWDGSNDGFVEVRDAAVVLLKGAGERLDLVLERNERLNDWEDALEWLADAENAEQFDDWLDEIFDIADDVRIWVG